MKAFFSFIFLILVGTMYVETLFAQNMDNKNFMVVGHRGASKYAPENTVAAANLAWKQNAHAVEIDVHLSSDNQIIVIHDYDTKRTSGQKYVVKETTYDILKKLDVGSWKDEIYKGEPIPIMADVVSTIPTGRKLVVEIKSEKKIVPIIKKKFGGHTKVDQLIFIAFDYETIVKTKNAFPDNKALWLSSKFPDGAKTYLERVKADGLDGVDLHYSLINEDLMKIANDMGLEVHVWTVDDLEKAKELYNLGVSSITTNIPDQVLKTINSK